MPLEGIEQPLTLSVCAGIRLRKQDGRYALALPGYPDPVVYQNSEGIFDPEKAPDLDYVKGMLDWLDRHGECYFTEALEGDDYRAIGDVTVKPENPPIAIWDAAYRGKGIGTKVMQTVLKRLRDLGMKKVFGSSVYKWNTRSKCMHESLGFQLTDETEKEYIYEKDLLDLSDHI